MVQFPTLPFFFHMLFNIRSRIPQSIFSFHMFPFSFFTFYAPAPPFFLTKKPVANMLHRHFTFFLLFFFFTLLHLLLGFVIKSTRHFLFFSIRPKYFCSKYSIYIKLSPFLFHRLFFNIFFFSFLFLFSLVFSMLSPISKCHDFLSTLQLTGP